MDRFLKPVAIAVFLAGAPTLQAQTADSAAQSAEAEGLLTQAELETLVAPVALYPDTLLIQILVAATNPLEVVKADRLLATTDQSDPQLLKAAVEAEGYDPSVEVLATAFPEVITDMAAHIEWTEAMGDAMLAQSEDVQTAIQTMRAQAINSGALVDGEGEQQTVEVSNDNNVVITPTDPQVVYVPQYDPQVVYQQNDNAVGDALMAGALTFGTVALIDSIFDDDDDWGGNYWGCRNCGGWGGGPIYRNPDVDIDVDGNVNIGNRVDIDRDKVNIDKDRWGDRDPDGGWKPDKDRQDKARDEIARKRGEGGKTKLPIDKTDAAKRDKLRQDLSARAGTTDISRPGSSAKVQDLKDRTPNAGKHRDAIARTGKAPTNVRKPAAQKPAAHRPAVKKPAAHKPAAKRPAAHTAHKKPTALAKRAPAHRTKAASHRGRASGGHAKRRR